MKDAAEVTPTLTPAPASRLDELSARERMINRERLANTATMKIRPDGPAGDAEHWRIRGIVSEALEAALSASDQTARERVVEECANAEPYAALRWVKCSCGHRSCNREYPSNLGTFYQGSGFDPEEKSLLDRAFAALAAERSGAPASEWRPISEAPKDGRAVLAADRRDCAYIASWSESVRSWVGEDGFCWDPTHFRDLPPPPSPSSTAGGRS